MLVTLVEGVIAQGKNEPSFQVEYSLDNVTWVNVNHKGAPEGEPQVNSFVFAQTKWFFKFTFLLLTCFKQRQSVIPQTRTYKEHCNIKNISCCITLYIKPIVCKRQIWFNKTKTGLDHGVLYPVLQTLWLHGENRTSKEYFCFSTSFKQRQSVLPVTRTYKEHCNIMNISLFIQFIQWFIKILFNSLPAAELHEQLQS